MKKIFICSICFMLIITSLFLSNNNMVVNASSVEDINSESYILLDKNSGEVIVENNAYNKMPVASICKLMTSLITLEKIETGAISLDDQFVASNYACSMEGSQAFLDANSKYKVYDLLKSVVVASANDSSVVLAEGISGSEKEFVKLMNERAKQLNMTNTFYENANGLPTPNQYSTAYDTSLILKEISKYNLYNEFSNIWMDKLVHPSGRETELVNTNRLIKYYDYCLNGKTGFTDEAGYCLASTAENNGLTLIAVVLKADDPASRFSDSVKLYNYGFANFENKQVIFKNEPLKAILKVSQGKQNSVLVAPKNDYFVLNKKGESANVSVNFNLQSVANAPIKAGDVLGKCVVIKNGKEVGFVDVISLENIDKQLMPDILQKIVYNWNIA